MFKKKEENHNQNYTGSEKTQSSSKENSTVIVSDAYLVCSNSPRQKMLHSSFINFAFISISSEINKNAFIYLWKGPFEAIDRIYSRV